MREDSILFQVLQCNLIGQKRLIFQINQEPDATIFQFIILTFVYSSTCFVRSPAHHQELMSAVAASGLPSFCGDSRAVFVVGPTKRR